MKRKQYGISLFLALILFFAALSGCGSSKEPENGSTGAPQKTASSEAGTGSVARVGDRVVYFKIRKFSGGEFNLSTLAGRPFVINFWASWCGPCKIEAETLQKVYLGFRDRGVEFVGVALQDTEEGSKKFIKRYGWTFAAGPDETGRLRDIYNVFGIPKTFVVGRDGRVSYIRSGPISEEELVREIKRVLR